MKKFCVLIALISVSMANVTVAAVNVVWGAENTAAYLYNSLGSLLDPENVSYQIEMVIDVDGNTDMSGLMAGYLGLTGDANGWDAFMHATAVDDIIVDARLWSWAGDDGFAFIGDAGTAVDDIYSGANFYFRWFNADSQANATEAGIIYGSGGIGNLSGWTVGPEPPAPAEPARMLDYDAADSLGTAFTGSAPEGWQTIQLVPEPGTMAMLFLGIATLGGAAAKKRKAAVVA